MPYNSATKEIAVSFLNLIIAGKIREAYDKYVGSGFRHHNPYFKGDAKSLMAGMEENEGLFPNKTFEIKNVLQDGDMVAVHSYLKLKPGLEMAVAHIFRFKDNRIVESWDLAQTIPENLPNENGMF